MKTIPRAAPTSSGDRTLSSASNVAFTVFAGCDEPMIFPRRSLIPARSQMALTVRFAWCSRCVSPRRVPSSPSALPGRPVPNAHLHPRAARRRPEQHRRAAVLLLDVVEDRVAPVQIEEVEVALGAGMRLVHGHADLRRLALPPAGQAAPVPAHDRRGEPHQRPALGDLRRPVDVHDRHRHDALHRLALRRARPERLEQLVQVVPLLLLAHPVDAGGSIGGPVFVPGGG